MANRRPAYAALFTLVCLAGLAGLGWTAAGPTGLLLPALTAVTAIQLPEGRRAHPGRTGIVLWQTLPLAAVGLWPFLVALVARWPVSSALVPALAAVLTLSLPVEKCREHGHPLALFLASCGAVAMVGWVLAVGLTSSATPSLFAQWRPFVDTYGPWIFSTGFLAFAGLLPLITVGERHHSVELPRHEALRRMAAGAGIGAGAGLVLGLTDPFPTPSPAVLWVLGGAATGTAVAAVDVLRQPWLRAMTWVLPKVAIADLERTRVETAIALGDALDGQEQAMGWELVWRRDYNRYDTEYGHPLRFEINRTFGGWGPMAEQAQQILGEIHERLDATYGAYTQTHSDTGTTPITPLSAHAKMAALARVQARPRHRAA